MLIKLINYIPVIVLLLILNNQTVMSQEPGHTGLIYGKNHSYKLSAPTGWILDNKSGVSQGLQAVFYKEGFNWDNAVSVMYTNVVHLDSAENRNLDDIINKDLERFKNYPEFLSAEFKDNIALNENKEARLIEFLSNDQNTSNESVAYIPEDKTIIIIVLSSRDKEDFNLNQIAFVDLVKSYQFISENVIIDDKK